MGTKQLHTRFSAEQVAVIFESHLSKEISTKNALETLEIGKTRFFALLGEYKKNPSGFSLEYTREKRTRTIGDIAERKIRKELEQDKKLIENKDIPITSYNYSAIRETLANTHNVVVSLPTIIARAKSWGYYQEKKKQTSLHDREVVTNFIGELLQHDTSLHLFSPYMDRKLYLITTIDDHSRRILFADLFERETTWTHIMALRKVILEFGCPLKYYADQHSIFRFVRDRDKQSPWTNFQKFTGDVETQFEQVLSDCGVGLTWALSPQAKGKVERPYRWIQDRLVRTAAKKKIANIEALREKLYALIDDYNTKWVHSATGEIPVLRFEKALNNNHCLFRPFSLAQGEKDLKDIFAVRTQRIVNPYRKVSIDGLEMTVPKGVPRETVDLRIVPDMEAGLCEIRFWQRGVYLGRQNVKTEDLKIVQF